MAKAKIKVKVKSTNGTPAPQADGVKPRPESDSVSGYFRKIFEENPKLLKGRSNEELLKRWRADHPGHKEVPEKIKNNLANIKSVLRKQGRKKGAKSAEVVLPVAAASEVAKSKHTPRGLEALEEQIDDCLGFAKRLDREGLADVIGLLRRARNGVVWKAGK
jgi:hypothetical protein